MASGGKFRVKINEEIKTGFEFCVKCYYKTLINKKCLTCSKRNTFTCGDCRQQIFDGELIAGKILCEQCSLTEHSRRKKYKDACIKNNTCYKCSNPIEKVNRVIYSEKNDAYDLITVVCSKCGPID
jgi:hypothetical protein